MVYVFPPAAEISFRQMPNFAQNLGFRLGKSYFGLGKPYFRLKNHILRPASHILLWKKTFSGIIRQFTPDRTPSSPDGREFSPFEAYFLLKNHRPVQTEDNPVHLEHILVQARDSSPRTNHIFPWKIVGHSIRDIVQPFWMTVQFVRMIFFSENLLVGSNKRDFSSYEPMFSSGRGFWTSGESLIASGDALIIRDVSVFSSVEHSPTPNIWMLRRAESLTALMY